MTPRPVETILEAYFEEGMEEHLSPFITPSTRFLALHLSLKAALFAAFLLLLAYLSSFFSLSENGTYLLLLFVYLLAGIPSLIESIEDLSNLEVNIDVLMTFAAFGSVLIGSPLEGGLLLVLFSISGAMEEMVARKAKSSLSSLHKLTPRFAYVLDGEGIYIEKALADVEAGNQILVKAGEVVPLDGVVLEGTSSVNLVHLTGENLPVTKKPGDAVAAGANNIEGALIVQVTHTMADSTLAKIIELVTRAQDAKPKLQRWFDTLSSTYAKTIILLALFFALTFPFILAIPFLGTEGSIYRALAFLIAASPCALIIAIPIAYLSAIGACARNGIVLKGGIILDALATCKSIAFDKTGTLTTGQMVCTEMEPLHPKDKDMSLDALDIAFAMEQNAHHPIAEAIVKFALANNRKPAPLSSFRSIPGYGLEADVKGSRVLIGNFEYIEPHLSEQDRLLLHRRAEQIRLQGENLALLLIRDQLYLFRLQDTLRDHAAATLSRLKKRGMRLLMLTGDNLESAQRLARELKIDEVFANLKPEDKLLVVEEQSRNSDLVMIGDGVNDAPALARATVGISMGKVGSATAIEAADVVLLQDNIEKLDWLLKKAKATRRVVAQNLVLATIAILLAAIPALLGIVPLWLAVVMHEGGTVLVGLNGLRLMRD
jgi:Zn2+/Cd2+-exporting ATPase